MTPYYLDNRSVRQQTIHEPPPNAMFSLIPWANSTILECVTLLSFEKRTELRRRQANRAPDDKQDACP